MVRCARGLQGRWSVKGRRWGRVAVEKEREQESSGSKSLTQQCSSEKHSIRLMGASV